MAIKGVAFDLEGTVINTDIEHHAAHLRVCKELGLDFTLEEAIEKIGYFIGGPDQKIAEEISRLSGGKTDPQWILAKDKGYYEELVRASEIKPREGFLDLLAHLRERNMPCAIGSLTDDEAAHFLLRKSGLDNLFDIRLVVLKSHVKNLKPAPDVFLKTAECMGIDPSEQIVFEDSPRGVEAAKRAGSRAIGMPVYRTEPVIAALKNAGVENVYLSWRDVPRTLFV